jgi:CheY-like chemotaxis protein
MAMHDFDQSTAMQQPFVPNLPDEQTHILIVDDSYRLCSLLVSSIVRECALSQRSCSVVQSSDLGMIETVPMHFSNSANKALLTIYTANSPRNALPVLHLAHIKKLTIICDIIMPSDTTVGLVGLLREISHLQLPVNLVFASSEGQNRAYVEQLIKYNKAFFLEKGSKAWIDIPIALVHRNQLFQYKPIVRSDYDKGRLPEEESYANFPAYQASPREKLKITEKLKGLWKK